MPPLLAGTKLDGYEILAPLGSGGMGEVYRARDPILRREVAIKVLPSSVSQDPERLRRFEQEAQAAAALNHPNIVAVHRFGVFDGSPYLVSELLEGSTLRQLLERGPISVRKATDAGVQVAHGLAAAHDKGIAHRDLKPENLFVTKDGRVKILDFGLAKVMLHHQEPDCGEATLTNTTQPGMVMGTAGYMAPEQVRGKPADHRTDIFVLGAILYEMLSGRRAFHRSTSADTISAILKEEPPVISTAEYTIPPGLQRVVHRCLEKDPEQRFQSASDLAFALEALSAGSSSSGVAITTDHRWSRRTILWLTGLVAAALLGAAYFLVAARSGGAALRVSEYTQITHDGRAGAVQGTDGIRLYLETGIQEPIRQVAISGGEIEPILSVTLPKPWLDDISPDGSTLLVESYGRGLTPARPTYVVPILGGSQRFLIDAAGSAWSPDGKSVVYFTPNGDINLVRSDGTEAHKLASPGGAPRGVSSISEAHGLPVPDSLSWSPDGRTIRFVRDYSLWEMSPNGGNLHQLLAGWHPSSWKCCGDWSPDGAYFVFAAGPGYQLWALDERGEFLRRRPEQPVQLTSGPIRWDYPVPSKDGKRIFARGSTIRGELNRFDSRFRKFEPFLGGISAEFVSFSKDGQAVAYVSYPDGILWRANKDGNERLQLSSPPLKPESLSWSPDGTEILFMSPTSTGQTEAYIVSSRGGGPRRLLPGDNGTEADPSWSPDGKKIIFGTNLVGGGDARNSDIRILDLASQQLTTLAGSSGMFSPHWSPDGQSIVTASLDLSTMFLFDLKTQGWSTIYKGLFAFATWSRDSHFVYFLRFAGDPAVLRVPAKGGKAEIVVGLKNFQQTGESGVWLGLDPADAPMLLRNVGTSDIYALTLNRNEGRD